MIKSHLRSLLEPLGNPTFAQWQQDYLRNQFRFLGIKVPVLRKAIKEFKKEHRSQNWRSEVEALFDEPEREFHHAAIYWAIDHRKSATPEDLSLYKKLLLTHSWWDTVDTIAPQLVGPLLAAHPELLKEIDRWIVSPHLWLRRAALIYPLYKRKEIDAKRLFATCDKLREDPDFFIRKAIGWMLREHSKTHPDAVAQFIQVTRLSPLSVREASKYLV